MAGRLVKTLTAGDDQKRREHGPWTPGTGAHVALWLMDGRWSVWGPGPQRGTKWLLPADDAARAVYAQLDGESSAGAPVALDVSQGCIAVRTSEMRRLLG